MTTEFVNKDGLQITRYARSGGGFLYALAFNTSNMSRDALESLMLLIVQVLEKEPKK